MKGKSKEKIRIGLLGGSFDPIHLGHLIIAETARINLKLDKVIFIPARLNPLKENSFASPVDRIKMIKLAISDNKYFDVSNIEINRKGPSYTIDTLLYFRKIYPRNCKIFFIIGYDNFLQFKKWKDPDRIVKLCKLAVFQRPDFEKKNSFFSTRGGSISDRKNKKHIVFIKAPVIDISSTEIRKRIKKNKSIKYLVPDSVEKFIKKNLIYG
jgi:nicotinate-nucleotide adenylyltransferase